MISGFTKRPQAFICLILLLIGGYGLFFWDHQAKVASLDLQGLASVADDCATSESSEHCISLIYVWSPSMPLSTMGIENAGAGAAQLGYSIHYLQAETLNEKASTTAEQLIVEQLKAAGALIHYPTIVVMINGTVRGTAIAGYKHANDYARLFQSRVEDFIATDREDDSNRSSGDVTGMMSLSSPKKFDTRVLARAPGHVGAFFQTAGLSWITYDRRRKNYAVSIGNGDIVKLPGQMDPIPSPDGRLLVTPSGKKSGLHFYQLKLDAEKIETLKLLEDNEMKDQYPTIGVLNQNSRYTDYRVLTSWYKGARFRDYRTEKGASDGAPTLSVLTAPQTACPQYNLSLPILSPDGQELAARDEDTGSSKLFRLQSDGKCSEVLDFGLQTGKLAFSADSRKTAFSIPYGTYKHGAGKIDFPASTDDLISGVFVLDRDTMVVTRVLPGDKLNNLTFPRFLGKNELLIMRYAESEKAASEFVSVCCID